MSKDFTPHELEDCLTSFFNRTTYSHSWAKTDKLHTNTVQGAGFGFVKYHLTGDDASLDHYIGFEYKINDDGNITDADFLVIIGEKAKSLFTFAKNVDESPYYELVMNEYPPSIKDIISKDTIEDFAVFFANMFDMTSKIRLDRRVNNETLDEKFKNRISYIMDHVLDLLINETKKVLNKDVVMVNCYESSNVKPSCLLDFKGVDISAFVKFICDCNSWNVRKSSVLSGNNKVTYCISWPGSGVLPSIIITRNGCKFGDGDRPRNHLMDSALPKIKELCESFNDNTPENKAVDKLVLNEGATVGDVIGSNMINKQTDHTFAFHGRPVNLTEFAAAPSRYGLIDTKTKQINEVAHLIYRAFAYAIDEIAKEDNIPISHMPAIQESTWEWLFAYKNHDGDICLACIGVGDLDHYELWYRDPKGIRHVFMRLDVGNGHITVYEGERDAVTHVSARAKVKVKELVKEYNNVRDFCTITVQKKPEELKEIAREHDKEVLSEFCNTLKEFSEEYADSWLINKFNKLIGVLKTYCFELNQVDRHKRYNDTMSWDWIYMSSHNLLPPVTMTGDRYHYDYNPTSFKIFDMYDSNGDLMVKVDHETFEINFYFYHSATEPFLTISANDYMGHVKRSYCDSHDHMDKFKFKYLTSLLEKELKIQIIDSFPDPVIIDDTWKNPDPSIFKIKGYTVDFFNTTTFKEENKMNNKKNEEYMIQDIIKDVIFDDPATTVLWTDGTKTTVKRMVTKYQSVITKDGGKEVPTERVPFDAEAALAAAIMNKMFGTHSKYAKFVKGYVATSESRKAAKKKKADKRGSAKKAKESPCVEEIVAVTKKKKSSIKKENK